MNYSVNCQDSRGQQLTTELVRTVLNVHVQCNNAAKFGFAEFSVAQLRSWILTYKAIQRFNSNCGLPMIQRSNFACRRIGRELVDAHVKIDNWVGEARVATGRIDLIMFVL